MKGGFSFCGVDIATIGLEYAPELDDTYVYNPSETSIHDEFYDGHTGGYFYGAYQRPKDFTLRCYFEDQNIRDGVMTKVRNLFRTGKSGKLIFQKRPWCYYHTTVVSNPEVSPTNYMNGLITIKMKAYYPFARCDCEWIPFGKEPHIGYNERTDLYHRDVMLNSAYPDYEDMVVPFSFSNVTSERNVVLLNPGTERASVGIACSGEASDGVTIINNTTGQSCRFVGLLTSKTSDIHKEIFMDGINGKTVLRDEDGDNSELAFLYHDYGYIELEPAYPAVRDLYIHFTEDSNSIYSTKILEEDLTGKYIFADGWYKIVDNDKHNILIDTTDKQISYTGTRNSMVVSMNELTIKPSSQGSTINLHKISFIYKATFS